ncbi:hypothetical protein ANACOL_02461 [Anaerotruncus colihominis DSM 17241]|uniref:Uncharacterized protein n=1 Tax=Anaerotruncus colihominis DSM 17241 TaxID=445972 RepID=B0PCF2_9FIRM|nr:hypothetical protein ANACOL_02461 [Anaerotruncus colihominis DSM 17241]
MKHSKSWGLFLQAFCAIFPGFDRLWALRGPFFGDYCKRTLPGALSSSFGRR